MKNYDKILKIYNYFIPIVFFLMGLFLHTTFIPRKLLWLSYIAFFMSIILIVIIDKSFDKTIKNIFDIREIILVLSLGFYWRSRQIFYNDHIDLNENIMYCIIPIMLYVIGKYYILLGKDDKLINIKNIILPLGYGTMLFFIVSMVSFYYYPYVEKSRMYHTILLPGSGNIAATFYGFYALIFISLIFYSIVYLKKYKAISLTIIISGLISAIWSFVVTGTRSPMFALVLTLFFSIIVYFIHLVRENGFDKYRKIIKVIIGAVIISILFLLISVFFVEPVKTLYRSSILFRDGGILGNQRLQWAYWSISDLAKYPWGGNHSLYPHTSINGYISSTNATWPDFAYYGGIIPFAGMMIFLLLSFKDIVITVISKELLLENKLLLVSPYLALIFLACTYNMQDICYQFSIIFLFAGMIRGQTLSLTSQKNLRQNNK